LLKVADGLSTSGGGVAAAALPSHDGKQAQNAPDLEQGTSSQFAP